MSDDPAHDLPPAARRYVSRGGIKLEHALREFKIDVTGLACADLGASTGGFTDCLLQHGARTVVSVDTAYGIFAWKLRTDTRVRVRERENALHASPVEGGVDLVVVDLGWTPQHLLLPVARRWLRPGGRIITLIKPHYEVSARTKSAARPSSPTVLSEQDSQRVTTETLAAAEALGFKVIASTPSPIRGGAVKAGSVAGSGNQEWLALLEPVLAADPIV